jgi:methylated-DNA-[protein]-cysteine S-methyltransferase
MTFHARFETTLGPMFATARHGAITGIYFVGGRHAPAIAADWREAPDDATLLACAQQVREYLDGARTRFDLPLSASGTAFQSRVWQAIAQIPYGMTASYAELAARVGAGNAARAVGAATGRNPLSIVVPCHRVLGSDGSATGYAGGLERKLRMLALERAAR